MCVFCIRVAKAELLDLSLTQEEENEVQERKLAGVLTANNKKVNYNFKVL